MEHDDRRKVLKGMGATAAGLVMPTFFIRNAWAADFRNDPSKSKTVTFGWTVPQTGPYADEGADELKAYKLAVKHLNGEGDGGMLKTMKPLSLKGNGVLGKKVAFVTGDTQTKADAARATAKRMIEKDGDHHVLRRLVVGGGGRAAVARPGDGRHLHGRPHALQRHHDKDRRRYGFRHFFNAYMSGKRARPGARQGISARTARPIT